MRIIADLHIHSLYSRATSKEMNLATIARVAAIKGINIVGTGDFTHPAHFASIEKELTPAENGLFRLKESKSKAAADVRFMLTAEVSNIYKQGDKTRKIHNLLFAPSLEAARKMNTVFDSKGNIKSDGRPIFGFTATDLLKIVLDSDPDSMLVPAHVWTPWFSVFGSKSGFDSIEECFGDLSKHIYALETGLSSDPQMNRRISSLDTLTLISNSDAHSPGKLGREANVLECAMDYFEIMDIFKTNDTERFIHTIEFYPEEGKYHADGHRACGVSLTPEQTALVSGICPVCTRPLTVGVLNRVDELADRPNDFVSDSTVPARHLVPLIEVVSECLGFGVNSKRVKTGYDRLLAEGGTEFSILLDKERAELVELAGERTAEAILRARSGEISIRSGFDGEFGKVSLFDTLEQPTPNGAYQTSL
jgi:uncharacterized protein (TIGR00375 family)